MDIAKYIYLIFLINLLGCGLFEVDPEPLEPIDAYFYAEINGESFQANGFKAGIESWRGYSFLEFLGGYYPEEIQPYAERMAFNLIYEEGATRYPLRIDSVLTKEVGFKVPNGSYSEKDWDVVITRFKTPEDSNGFLTVELEELEDGRKTISRNFEMTVYLTERINTAYPQQEQDTLHIPNGRYKMLLNDKRDE